MKKIKHFLQGLIVGTAELVPGVSGANFAMIMGIYDDYIIFLDKLTNFFGSLSKYFIRKSKFTSVKEAAKSTRWLFGVPLLAGMFIASVIFSNVITVILEDYPNFIYSLFFGLVGGSLIVPWVEMKSRKPYHFLIMLISAIFAFIIFGLKPVSYGINPPQALLFIAGILGTVGAILPGISGTFLLILFGLYDFVINLLASITTLNFDINQLKNFALYFTGQLIGLISFIKLVKYLLEKFPDALMAFIFGIIAASLRIVYPWFTVNESGDRIPTSLSHFNLSENILMIGLAIFGFVVVIMAGKLGADRRQIKKIENQNKN